MEKQILGRSEKVSLPEFSINSIDAKIDTGAYTSSIHCTNIEKVDENTVRCNLLGDKEVTLSIEGETNVKSSNGQSEDRVLVKMVVKLLETEYDILFTLTDRSEMKNPVLIGREFLNNKFVIEMRENMERRLKSISENTYKKDSIMTHKLPRRLVSLSEMKVNTGRVNEAVRSNDEIISQIQSNAEDEHDEPKLKAKRYVEWINDNEKETIKNGCKAFGITEAELAKLKKEGVIVEAMFDDMAFHITIKDEHLKEFLNEDKTVNDKNIDDIGTAVYDKIPIDRDFSKKSFKSQVTSKRAIRKAMKDLGYSTDDESVVKVQNYMKANVDEGKINERAFLDNRSKRVNEAGSQKFGYDENPIVDAAMDGLMYALINWGVDGKGSSEKAIKKYSQIIDLEKGSGSADKMVKGEVEREAKLIAEMPHADETDPKKVEKEYMEMYKKAK